MGIRIKLRRDTSTNWTSNNPILVEGELAYETDTKKFKLGDGVTAWNGLSYFTMIGSATDVLTLLKTVDGASSLLDADLLDGQEGSYYLAWANLTDVPTTFAPAAHTLDSHSNVSIASIDAGELLKWSGTAWVNNTLAEAGIQPYDADLATIAALTGTYGFLKKTGENTWSIDTSTYLTGNQTISLSGDATGSGATTIVVTLANTGVAAGTYNNTATAVQPFTVDSKGRLTNVGTNVTITPAWSSISSKPTTISGFGITDAYTKTEVDTMVTGLDFKDSVRVATTENITLANLQTIDGVSLSAGMRVLVKNQNTESQNGIYVAVDGGSWTRATDANTSAKVTPGLYCFVEEGSTYGNTGWVLSTDAPITLGTTSLVFAQFNGLASITAGDGLSLSGSMVYLDTPGTITASSTNTVTADSHTHAITGFSETTHVHGDITAGGQITATAVSPANGDYVLLSDTSNSGKIARGIAIGTSTTTFLRNDGTWVDPTPTTIDGGNSVS